MKHKLQFAAWLLAAALPVTTLAQPAMPPGQEGGPAMHHGGAMHGHARQHGGPMGHQPHFLQGIKLSEAQQDKVFAIRHAAVPTARQQMKALHQAHEQLHTLVFAERYDEAAVKAQVDVIARTTAELALQHASNDRKILDVLTPEQRRQAVENKAKHHPAH